MLALHTDLKAIRSSKQMQCALPAAEGLQVNAPRQQVNVSSAQHLAGLCAHADPEAAVAAQQWEADFQAVGRGSLHCTCPLLQDCHPLMSSHSTSAVPAVLRRLL